MIKYFILLFNMIALIIYKAFFAGDISVTQSAPASSKQGSDFTVELTINKGETGGFAKLQQELPAGFTATAIQSKGASFSFSNQTVKFIWTSLPAEAEFKISYKVTVGAGVSGDQSISGKFSYVFDNVKKSVEISPAVITISSDNNPPPLSAVPDNSAGNQNATGSTTTPPAAGSQTPSSATCVRKVQTPSDASSPGDLIMEIVINKGNLSGFAKLQETLPEGFTATGLQTNGASFTFTEQKVKFVWLSLPAQSEFTVSYKISAEKGLTGTKNIEGLFSFIENDETKKYILPVYPIDLNAPVANSPTQNAASTAPTSNPIQDNSQAITQNTPTDNAATTKAETPASQKESANPTASAEKKLSATNIPSPQNGINYRVQICALHKSIESSYFTAKYHISEAIFTEMHEGWSKYTLGNFNEYKQTRDHREEIRGKGVINPFVTAYNNGKRITVQEALMVSNQKWFK